MKTMVLFSSGLRRWAAVILLLTAVVLSGCAEAPLPVTPTPIPGKPVAPQFVGLYETIAGVIPGGLGAARSEAVDEDGQIRQIFDGGVLVYDKTSGVTALAPVGKEQIATEPPSKEPEGPTWRQIGEYWVPAAIANAYDALGEDVVGHPLTNYRYNSAQQRFEMYFENLGMYIWKDDPYSQVYLLPYGAWVYADRVPLQENVLRANIARDATEAFDAWEDRLTREFTGEEIAPLITDAQGRILRVYANVVPEWNQEQGIVQLVHVPLELGVERQPLKPRVDNDRMMFLPLDESGTLGHNIPRFFWDNLISKYSGIDVFGEPITELEFKPGTQQEVYWQCFENLCVEFDGNTDTNAITPLGRQYYERFLK